MFRCRIISRERLHAQAGVAELKPVSDDARVFRIASLHAQAGVAELKRTKDETGEERTYAVSTRKQAWPN